MDPNYHEGYWLALAAAAPVISLGYLLTFERATSRLTDSQQGWNSLGISIWGTLVVMLFGLASPGWVLFRALTSLMERRDDSVMLGPLYLLIGSLIGAFWISMYGALQRLAKRADDTSATVSAERAERVEQTLARVDDTLARLRSEVPEKEGASSADGVGPRPVRGGPSGPGRLG